MKENYLNTLEMVLAAKDGIYPLSSGCYGSNGFYDAGGASYFTYGKHKSDKEKRNLIESEISINFKERVLASLTVFSFRHIRKNYEHIAIRAMLFNDDYDWERWGVLKDGTILNPIETKDKIASGIDMSYSLSDDIPF